MTVPIWIGFTDISRGDNMKMIAEIVESIREELDGAEHYAKKATQYKEQDYRLADMYATMANQELVHVDALHAQAVRMIQDYRSSGKEPPAGMQSVWEWEHEKMVSHVTKIKMLLEMYNK